MFMPSVDVQTFIIPHEGGLNLFVAVTANIYSDCLSLRCVRCSSRRAILITQPLLLACKVCGVYIPRIFGVGIVEGPDSYIFSLRVFVVIEKAIVPRNSLSTVPRFKSPGCIEGVLPRGCAGRGISVNGTGRYCQVTFAPEGEPDYCRDE